MDNIPWKARPNAVSSGNFPRAACLAIQADGINRRLILRTSEGSTTLFLSKETGRLEGDAVGNVGS